MKSALPTATDLENLYQSTGVINPANEPYNTVDWASAVSDAIQEFQSETGRILVPTYSTRYFDPPAGNKAVLTLNGDLASASLIVNPPPVPGEGIAPSGTVQYLNGKNLITQLQGTAMICNADYYWGPGNADTDGPLNSAGTAPVGKPWTWLEFNNYFPSPLQVYLRKSILITGYWGYTALDAESNPQIYDDIWHGILHAAAIDVIPEIELSLSHARSQAENVTFKSVFNALKPQRELWTESSKKAITRHKRVEIWA